MSASSQALEFLEQLPGIVHKRLYQQPSSALAVFRRMLPHLAKTIVMAMLYMANPFPDADLDAWIRPDSRAEKDQAMSVLERLHIVGRAQDPQAPRAYVLATGFARSLRQALTGGGSHRSFGVPCDTPDEKKVDINFLDAFARTQWEAILYYMVGSTGAGLAAGTTISPGTKKLLELGNYVEIKLGKAAITQTGFTFLLQEVNAQVWSLLIVYLEHAESLSMDQVDVLSFLFMLGSLELGQDYSTADLTATQQHMLDDLNDFGIIYRRTPQSPRFYPTRLATTLTSDAGALLNTNSTFDVGLRSNSSSNPSSAGAKGYIIVETNYRLYAYTSSVLQIAVLALFTRLNTRFPNLVSGKLTKESVQRAIGYGITADQIISYLSAHAHPQMARGGGFGSGSGGQPVLPPTVMDQIRLWQIEGDRLEATPGFLMKEFATQAEYEETVRYAEALGVLRWKDDKRRMFFVARIDQISAFLKSKQAARKGV